MLRPLSSLLLLAASSAALAFPEQCFQRPQRQTPCEHLIYKRVVFENASEPETVCVCLRDFRDLIIPGQTEADRIRQRNQLKQYSAELGVSEQNLLKLIRY